MRRLFLSLILLAVLAAPGAGEETAAIDILRNPGAYSDRYLTVRGTMMNVRPAAVGVATPAPRADASLDPLRKELEAFFAGNADVIAYFLPEATEHLDGVTSALGALERGVDEADVARLFRAVHTLKGAASVVGCVRVGEVAHRMEDVLVVAREGRGPLTPTAVETLLAAEGALRLMLGLPPDPRANVTDVVAVVRARLRRQETEAA